MSGSNRTDGVKRPLFWGGLSAVVVTLAALSAPLWWTLSLAAVLLVGCCLRRGVLCALLTVAFLLLSVGYRHTYIDPARHLDGQTDTITGVVVETPSYGKMYTLQVSSSAYLRTNTRVMLLCEGEEKPALYDTVVAKVRLYGAENSRDYASRGALVRAFPADYLDSDVVVVGSTETAFHSWIYRVRQTLTAPAREVLNQTESGILTAVCFGDRSYLTDEVSDGFRDSGLSHLLVVSGLHVSMVALALRRLLRRGGRHVSCLVPLAGVWWFAWVVGLSPSVLRAATMCTVWLVGQWLFCRSDGLNSLGLAAVVVLAADPSAVWNGGFQLSFAATLGVLLLARRLTPHYEAEYDAPWWRRLWLAMHQTAVSGAAVCLSALLFTLPIAVYQYGGFSSTAVVSNVLAVAPVGAMMALGWLGTLLKLVPFLGWLGRGLLLVAGVLARYVNGVAQLCSPDWAWVSVTHTWQQWLIIGLCLIAVCGILCRIAWRRLLAVLSLLAVTVTCIGTPLTTYSIQLTVLSLDNEGAFVVAQGDRTALLLTHGRELDEAAYAVARLDPDVIFIDDATAEDSGRLDRFPDATVFTTFAVAQRWQGREVTVCPTGGTITLWEGCRLTLVTDVWWRLSVGGETVYICTDPKSAPRATEYLCIYVGGTPTEPPPAAYAVVCSKAWLRRRHPSLTGWETFIVERPTTYVPQGGEWRVLPWL